MRISDLFDELEQGERETLLDLPIREKPAVSRRTLRRRVNAALDKDPIERKKHMKQLFKKGVCAALIAASLLTGAFAVSQTDFWKELFPGGNTAGLKVNTVTQSIDNGDVRLTLEQSLSDETILYVVYSLTGLTDTGKRLVEDDTYTEGLNCAVSAWNQQEDNPLGQSWGPMSEYDTADTKFFRMTLEPVPGGIELRLRGAKDSIPIPATTNVQVAEMNLPDIPFTNYAGESLLLHHVRLTNLGYCWSYTRISEEMTLFPLSECEFYFALKDGSIRSLAQQRVGQQNANGGWSNGLWDHVLDVEQIEGVIINDIEYYFDGREPVHRMVPAEFKVIPSSTWRNDELSYLGVPLRAVVEQFGGTVSWDAETQSAVATFRGVSCVCADGDRIVRRDGKTVVSSDRPLVKTVNGIMYVDSTILQKGLDLAVVDSYDRADAASPSERTIWYIAS